MEGISWVSLKPHRSDFSCWSERNVPFHFFIPVYITRCSAFKVRQAAFIISLRINLSGHKSWIYYDRGDGRLITNTAGISIFGEQNLNFPNCFSPLLPLFNLIPAGLQRHLGLWPFRFLTWDSVGFDEFTAPQISFLSFNLVLSLSPGCHQQ